MKYIHIWEFPLEHLSISLEAKLREYFFSKVYSYFKKPRYIAKFLNKKAKKYNKKSGFDWKLLWYFRKKSKFIPAWIIFELAKKINFDFNIIEKNVKSYITFRGKVVIKNPKLPIIITPEFAYVMANMLGDGVLVINRLFYFQKSNENQQNFIRKIKNIFGEIESKYKKGYYLPKVITQLIFKYYDYPEISTFKGRIPKKIKQGNKLEKLAALTAFLTDEGHIGADITFRVANKRLLQDFREIAVDLGYNCSNIFSYKMQKSKNLLYGFKIYVNSYKKFLNDLRSLTAKYPSCNPGEKLKTLEKMVAIRNRNWKQRAKRETKNIILNAVKESPKTASELRDITSTTMWTVYHHLQHLSKEGKVTKISIGGKGNLNLFALKL